MDSAIEFVTSYLASNGNSVPYRALHDNVPPLTRQYLPRALDALKAQGKVTQTVRFDANAGGIVHTVEMIG